MKAYSVIILLLLALPVAAQVSSMPEVVAAGGLDADAQLLATWADLARDHTKWNDLQTVLQARLKRATLGSTSVQPGSTKPQPYELDFQKHYYTLVFPNQRGEEVEVVRILLHDPPPEAHMNRIEGVREIHEIALAPTAETVLRSTYISTRVENPTEAKVADFIKLFDLAKLLPVFKGFAVGERAKPQLRVLVSRIALPFDRATIKVTDAYAIAPGPILMPTQTAKLIQDADELQASLDLRDARSSPCAKELTSALAKAIQKTGKPARATTEVPVDREAMQHAIRTAYADTTATCVEPGDPAAARMDTQLLTAIEQRFLTLLKPAEPKKASRETTYDNSPRERWSLGVITSAIAWQSTSGTRAKVADGKLAADPLSGTATHAVATFRPYATDPKAASFPRRERLLLYVGGVLAPEFGFTAGAGFSLTRKVALNLGLALIRIDVPRNDEVIGNAPINTKAPLRNSLARLGVIGFGYTF